MRIKVLDVKLSADISYDMIGYSEVHTDTLRVVKRVRPDIEVTQLRRLDQHLGMEIKYSIKKKVYTKRLVYRPGFIFDTASIPNLMKWLIDNDAANMLIPSLYHDAAFALNFDSFKLSNAMFRALCIYYGKKYDVRLPVIKSIIAWSGVASPIGKKIYYGIEPINHFNYGLCYEY